VLSGIIGALMLRKDISVLNAAALGAFIHGRAGETCCAREKTAVLKATDIIKYIREQFYN
jgi:NAD(P)H-hydrate repair Nnr-like enzyme with NAD(P)H-hydrate dehydratase domain